MKYLVLILLFLSLNAFSIEINLGEKSSKKDINEVFHHYHNKLLKNKSLNEYKDELMKRYKLFRRELGKKDTNKRILLIAVENNIRLYEDVASAGREGISFSRYRKNVKRRFEKSESDLLNDFYSGEGRGLNKKEALEKVYGLIQKDLAWFQTKGKGQVQNIDSFFNVAKKMYEKGEVGKLLILRKGIRNVIKSK